MPINNMASVPDPGQDVEIMYQTKNRNFSRTQSRASGTFLSWWFGVTSCALVGLACGEDIGRDSSLGSTFSGHGAGETEAGDETGGGEGGDETTSDERDSEDDEGVGEESAGDGDGDADESTGDGDGDGDGEESAGDGDGDADESTGDGDGEGEDRGLPMWILSIDETDETTDRLIRISVDEMDIGTVTEICADIILPDSIPANSAFTSLTFNNDTLYASAQDAENGDTLMVINPCSCEAFEVGKYGYNSVNGITSNADHAMYGIAVAEDVMLDINPNDAMSSVLHELGANWGPTGLTWSQAEDNVLYAINAKNDRLYTFDGNTAEELGQTQLNRDFFRVGLEMHPDLGTLYACGVSGSLRDLYGIDVQTGDVELLAIDVWQTECDNIAAPFGPVQCIPQ